MNAEIQKYIENLKSPFKDVRLTAASSLGAFDTEETISALIEALDDEKWEVRRAAIESLGNMKAMAAVPRLLACLDDPEWRVRQGAAFALGYIGEESAHEKLILLLKQDKEWRVRQGCAYALSNFPGSKTINAITEALSDGDWHVQVQAAESLGIIGNLLSEKPLKDALPSADPRMKLVINIALKKISRKNKPVGKAKTEKTTGITRQKLEKMKNQCRGCKDE